MHSVQWRVLKLTVGLCHGLTHCYVLTYSICTFDTANVHCAQRFSKLYLFTSILSSPEYLLRLLAKTSLTAHLINLYWLSSYMDPHSWMFFYGENVLTNHTKNSQWETQGPLSKNWCRPYSVGIKHQPLFQTLVASYKHLTQVLLPNCMVIFMTNEHIGTTQFYMMSSHMCFRYHLIVW